MYQVVKRDGKVTEFEISKISKAITKAFEALEKQYHPSVIDMLALRVTAEYEPKIRDGKITVEDIQEFCTGMPRYKRPRKIILAPVPRNATGKIEKPKLRRMYGGEGLVDSQNRS